MNSEQYWRKREAANLVKMLKDEKAYQRELERIYKDMLDAAQKEIEAFYGRYADKEGITIAEARKRVSKADIEAYERKAKRYVKDKDFSPQANEEMRLYNLTMKVNRLEMLKANIGLELLAGHSELETFMEKILRGRTEAELKRQAGILGETIRNNAKLADSIVNGSWKNATFSQRLWGHQSQMKADIGKLLENGMIQGKNARVLANELKQYYIGEPTLKNGKAGAKYYTERLMRTELARVQTEAQRQSFEKNGFEEYIFIVNGGCCSDCAAIAKKNNGVYKVKDMMPGLNAPPVHPHCRCSVAAYEDSDEYEAWLDFLDKGGTTEAWNRLKRPREMALENAIKWPPKGTKISNEEYKECMSYAREKGIELSGFKRFDGDAQTIKELVDDADAVAKRFPEIKEGKRKMVIALNSMMSPNDFAITDGHIISINANAFRDTKKLAEEYAKAVEEGWFVKGTDYRSIIKHEVGHLVADKYKIDCLSIAMECTGIKSKVELMEWLTENLSEYSASFEDGSEIISECFASAYGSEKPIDFALKFIEKCANMKP